MGGGFTNFIAKEMMNDIAQYEEIDNDLVFEINHIYETLSMVGNEWETLIVMFKGIKEHFPKKIALFDEVLKNSNFDNFERPEQIEIKADFTNKK